MNYYRDREFLALAAAVHLGDCPAGILSDWLIDHGEGEHKASETLLPYLPSQFYKGVSWARRQRKWVVSICLGGGHNTHLGYFEQEDEAACG